MKGSIEAVLAAFETLKPRWKSAFELLKAALKDFRFCKGTFFNALETEFALYQMMNLDLADLPYRTCNAEHQSASFDDVFPRKDTVDAVTFMTSLVATGAYDNSFGLTLQFYVEN